MPDDLLRIANGSGFYGDRADAMLELVEGGPLDVLTGDYLAELTMLVLWRGRQSRGVGWARTFLRQARDLLAPCLSGGTRIVVNAGGLDPAGCAAAVRELAAELGLSPAVAHLEGDDLLPRLSRLQADGHELANLATGAPLASLAVPPLTANAYLGAWGIAHALEQGADVVVTGRVTDASLVVGPAAWRFGWRRDDWDRLAGAVVVGHVLECGAQATGGNYAFFDEVPGFTDDLAPPLPGYPVAELAPDGSAVITKHPGTGGLVSVGTVTAQLLYEIDGAAYANPDVVARFDSVRLEQLGPDRVRVAGVRGEPPPATSKVAVTTLGGFRNRATFVLTGLDIDAKAALVRRQLAALLDLDAIDEVEWRLVRSDRPDADANALATASLTVTVTHHAPEPIGRRTFADACVAIGLASYPGFTLTAPPADAEPFGRYWPALIDTDTLTEVVVLDDGSRLEIVPTATRPGLGDRTLTGWEPGPVPGPVTGQGSAADGEVVRVPLGRLVGARAGDKGGDVNVGVWVRDERLLPWLTATLGTPDAVRRLLPEAADLHVDVVALPNLRALNIVVRGLLGDGVASATRPDPQGKGFGEYLRSRHVEVPRSLLEPAHRTNHRDG